MKKIVAFFSLHLFIIITLQIYLVFDSVFEKNSIPVIGFLKKDIYSKSPMKHYLMFSGINTGYGFYGINVATNKYFIVEIININKNIIKKINVNNFNSANSFSRFSTCGSFIYNFNVETNEIKKKDKKNSERYCLLRDKFVSKIYKYIGKREVNDIKNCESFKVKLITVVPPNIWNNKLEKNNIYVLQEFSFKNK